MRASEDAPTDPDEKRSLAGTAQQGLDAQKPPYNPRAAAADRDIVRQPGDVAPSVKEQLQRNIDWNRKQGYTSDKDLNVQQKTERDNLMRDTFPSRPAQHEANAATPKWGVSGTVSYGRARPKDGPNDATANVGVTYGTKEQQDKLEEEKLRNTQLSPNQTGPKED